MLLCMLASCLSAGAAAGESNGPAPTGLMCELMEHPELTTITDPNPEFGWIVNSELQNDVQTAYQILVATDSALLAEDRADMWDTGRAEGRESSNVEYRGNALKPHTSYFWKVRTWNRHGDASDWSKAQTFRTGRFDAAGRDWTAWDNRYPLEKRRVKPVGIVRYSDENRYFFDFGQAAFGIVELTITSESEAHQIEVHLGEKLNESGRVDRKPPGTIRYRKIIVALRKGTHTYTVAIPPDKRNTGSAAIKMPADIGEVLPFRYCEIVNCPFELTRESVTQIAINYHFNDHASLFVCNSDRILDRVWRLCKYSIKATSFCGVYVDGDRERIPYEADAYINQLCHYAVDREYTMARFSHEYLIEHPTWPTEWIMHSVLMAWADYMWTGNAESMEAYYEDLKAKTLIALARPDGLISVNTGMVTDELLRAIHLKEKPRDLVDWPPASFTTNKQYGERDRYDMVAVNTVVNALHYRALCIMADIAERLGHAGDAQRFGMQSRLVKATFNEKLFDAERGVYIDGEGSTHAALHANMFPLAFGLVPPDRVESVVRFIKSRGMKCSVYGAQYLLEALYAAGEGEYALQLMTATHDRSWHNMMAIGSTITLEAWDWKYKNNLDWNHAWGAAPANIIPFGLMGITPMEPGFAKIQIKPQPGGLQRATYNLPTIKGTVIVGFKESDRSFLMGVNVPANTTARVCVPSFGSRSGSIVVDNAKTTGTIEGGFIVVDNVGSGDHVFEVQKQDRD